MRVIQILLLNYLGRADMEFLLTLGPGGGGPPSHPSAHHRQHTHTHTYHDDDRGQERHLRARCLQVSTESWPRTRLDHVRAFLLGKPSPVEVQRRQRQPAIRVIPATGPPLAPGLGPDLCHRPLAPAPSEAGRFFWESFPFLDSQHLTPFCHWICIHGWSCYRHSICKN